MKSHRYFPAPTQSFPSRGQRFPAGSPGVETLEERSMLSVAPVYYSIDGSGNNLADPALGPALLGIEHNTEITNLQKNVFIFQKGTIAGTVFADGDRNGIRESTEAGVAGVNVELLDRAGNVVTQTVTASDGSYAFETGQQAKTFSVVVTPPAHAALTTRSPRNVTLVSNTGAAEYDVDFGLWGKLKSSGARRLAAATRSPLR